MAAKPAPTTARLVSTLGGRRALRSHVGSTDELRERLRRGLPFAAVPALGAAYRLDGKRWAALLSIPDRTFALRRPERRLRPAEPARPARPRPDRRRRSRLARHRGDPRRPSSQSVAPNPRARGARPTGDAMGAARAHGRARGAVGRGSRRAQLPPQSDAPGLPRHRGTARRTVHARPADVEVTGGPITRAPSDSPSSPPPAPARPSPLLLTPAAPPARGARTPARPPGRPPPTRPSPPAARTAAPRARSSPARARRRA